MAGGFQVFQIVKDWFWVLLFAAVCLGTYLFVDPSKAARPALLSGAAKAGQEPDPHEDHAKGEAAANSGQYGVALRYFLKGASRNQPFDEDWLGTFYLNGKGVEQDYAAALAWFQKAADQNDPTAEEYLGYMYEGGLGVETDLGKARDWYKKSADQGNELARQALADLDRPQ